MHWDLIKIIINFFAVNTFNLHLQTSEEEGFQIHKILPLSLVPLLIIFIIFMY